MQTLYHGLTLLPPSPVSDKATVDLKIGVLPGPASAGRWDLRLYLDEVSLDGLLAQWEHDSCDGSPIAVTHVLHGYGRVGTHRVIAVVTPPDGEALRIEKPLEILECDTLSTGTIDGAFSGFYHWSEKEGRLWNTELAQMTEADWCHLLRTQHALGMSVVVPQEAFRNECYVGRHTLEKDGYNGSAYYPSRLVSGRMPITCPDPLETVLACADELGMQVFLPIGLYAWFDFTPASLAWHKEVTLELWERYGHHPSVYGFYVGEEICGDLGANDARRDEIVAFFREYTPFARSLAPDKPVMLASNCHNVAAGLKWYPRLLENLDILCPFAFHRMPPEDQTGEEAAMMLQELCAKSACHLWMDLEAFFFHPDTALYPCPLDHLTDNLERFTMFEKIICYQFPGLFNAPGSRLTPGGPATVVLFNEYQEFLATRHARDAKERSEAEARRQAPVS